MASTVERRGEHRGLEWMCVATDMGHRCGYVKVPKGHPLHGLPHDATAPGANRSEIENKPIGKRGIMSVVAMAGQDGEDVPLDGLFDVHGSLTFSGAMKHDDDPDGWWLGFDCAHSGDGKDVQLMSKEHFVIERRYGLGDWGPVRTADYVEAECKSLARQIADRWRLVESKEATP